MAKNRFLIINGPNLNMLGTREPAIYGSDTLKDVQAWTEAKFTGQSVALDWFQSNIEGEIVTKIQNISSNNYLALVINPGAYSHTSIAIYDALKMVNLPIIEVHLSNTHGREPFRSIKITAKASTIIMEGLGKQAYFQAINSQLINKGL
jgi:3-dehydroquinate dehydratase II